MKRSRASLTHLVAAAVILISSFFLFDVCKKKEATLSPTKLVREIFGRPEKVEDSGVISAEYNEPDYVIQYNFNPPGKSKYEEELGKELSAKIDRLFDKDKTAGSVQITIFGLSKDAYGTTGWKPALYFEVDRSTIESEDWKKLDKKELLSVVKNLKWFRKETNES